MGQVKKQRNSGNQKMQALNEFVNFFEDEQRSVGAVPMDDLPNTCYKYIEDLDFPSIKCDCASKYHAHSRYILY